MSREELLGRIQSQVKASRFKHMLGVEKAAAELAARFGGDIYQASLAGLLHDYAKEVSTEEFFRLIENYRLDSDLKKWGNAVWHGKVGFLKIKEDLGLNDEEILHAIEVHTVGDKAMSLLDKIVYVADYIEEGRDFPGVEKARQLAELSLDKALAYETRETMIYLAKHNLPIYPQTLETYNSYIAALADKD